MTKSMDEAVTSAWQDYEQQLLTRIAGLTDDLILSGPAPAEDESPFVALMRQPDGELEAQLVMTTAPTGLEAVELLGWQRRGEVEDGDVPLFVGRGGPGDLAALACSTLRSLFGVLAPAFIEETEVTEPACELHDGSPPVLEPGITSQDQLTGLVRGALERHLGRPVEADDEGDFPVRHGSAGVWVRVDPERPAVHFFAHAVRGVRRKAQAAIEVNLLNRDTYGVTFVLSGNLVLARTDLLVDDFSERAFLATLANITGVVDSMDEDLALRVGGRTFFREAS